MKRIVSIFLAVILAVVLTSCTTATNGQNQEVENRFRKVYMDYNNSILVDEETGVMYLYRGSGYGGGLTVMVNKDGTPLLWE